jgi:hypothetical protein
LRQAVKLTGYITLQNSERGQRELLTLMGHSAAISAGEWVTAAGNWANDRTHGQQFTAPMPITRLPWRQARPVLKGRSGHSGRPYALARALRDRDPKLTQAQAVLKASSDPEFVAKNREETTTRMIRASRLYG